MMPRPLHDAESALDRDVLSHYLDAAAVYHERSRTRVVIAGTTLQRVLTLCGDHRAPRYVAHAYSLTPTEARGYARRLCRTEDAPEPEP